MEGYDAVAYYDTDIEFQAPGGLGLRAILF